MENIEQLFCEVTFEITEREVQMPSFHVKSELSEPNIPIAMNKKLTFRSCHQNVESNTYNDEYVSSTNSNSSSNSNSNSNSDNNVDSSRTSDRGLAKKLQPPMNPFLDTNFAMHRFFTFADNFSTSIALRLEFANNGFYLVENNVGNVVQCKFCLLEITNFEQITSVQSTHRVQNSSCPFLHEQPEVVNVEIIDPSNFFYESHRVYTFLTMDPALIKNVISPSAFELAEQGFYRIGHPSLCLARCVFCKLVVTFGPETAKSVGWRTLHRSVKYHHQRLRPWCPFLAKSETLRNVPLGREKDTISILRRTSDARGYVSLTNPYSRPNIACDKNIHVLDPEGHDFSKEYFGIVDSSVPKNEEFALKSSRLFTFFNDDFWRAVAGRNDDDDNSDDDYQRSESNVLTRANFKIKNKNKNEYTSEIDASNDCSRKRVPNDHFEMNMRELVEELASAGFFSVQHVDERSKFHKKKCFCGHCDYTKEDLKREAAKFGCSERGHHTRDDIFKNNNVERQGERVIRKEDNKKKEKVYEPNQKRQSHVNSTGLLENNAGPINGRKIVCFYCGVQYIFPKMAKLLHQTLKHCPWTEHAMRAPHCAYLRLAKGTGFVTDVQFRMNKLRIKKSSRKLKKIEEQVDGAIEMLRSKDRQHERRNDRGDHHKRNQPIDHTPLVLHSNIFDGCQSIAKVFLGHRAVTLCFEQCNSIDMCCLPQINQYEKIPDEDLIERNQQGLNTSRIKKKDFMVPCMICHCRFIDTLMLDCGHLNACYICATKRLTCVQCLSHVRSILPIEFK